MLEMAEQNSMRDARGRFVPGQSGNPGGKTPGTRNRATLLRAALESDEGPAMARIVIDKALAGDAVTARFCLDRLEPRPRGRSIAIELPKGPRARDVVAAFDATLRAMASGEITPDEAVQVTRVLDGRRKAIEAAWRERGIEDECAADDAEDEIEPSPSGGRGLGEGLPHVFFHEGKIRATSPHPDPLPEGEGIVRAGDGMSVAESAAPAGITPRAPSARAMAPSLSCKGRGVGLGAFGGNLLHSTCISSQSRALDWVANRRV